MYRGRQQYIQYVEDKEVSDGGKHMFGGRASLYIQTLRARLSMRISSYVPFPKTMVSAAALRYSSTWETSNVEKTSTDGRMLERGKSSGIRSHRAEQSYR